MFQSYTISRKKGRAFSAPLLARVDAPNLWEKGTTDRPVWAMFGGTEGSLKPFVANLVLGRPAEVRRNQWSRHREGYIEFLKSVRYHVTWQKSEAGALVTLFLPELFRLDPGMVDPEGLKFIMMPSLEWVSRGVEDSEALRALAVSLGCPEERSKWFGEIAHLFAAYVDRRTRCPLVADPKFYVRLLATCLQLGLASWPMERSYGWYHQNDLPWGVHMRLDLSETGTKAAGLLSPIIMNTNHDLFETVLADTVTAHFEVNAQTPLFCDEGDHG